MRLLPFSWFSMKLGMINSFLIVCFTMVQKNIQVGKNYKILTKISRNGYKTIFFKEKMHYNKYKRENVPIIFLRFRLTKQFMIIR